MEEKIKTIEVSTQPLSTIDKKLDEKFAESIAEQSKLMDEIGKQLLTIELAIPGIYATILKLISGEEATLHGGVWVVVTFGLWLVALVVTFFAIVPNRYRVDTNRPDEIERFFMQSARDKYRMLLASAFLFFVGVIASLFTIF